MWRELEDTAMKTGMVSVDKSRKRVVFGAATVRAWKLDRFHSVNALYNDEADLAGFQFYENGDGKRQVIRAVHGISINVNCQPLLRICGAKPGRYQARKERSNFFTVNFRGRNDV